MEAKDNDARNEVEYKKEIHLTITECVDSEKLIHNQLKNPKGKQFELACQMAYVYS